MSFHVRNGGRCDAGYAKDLLVQLALSTGVGHGDGRPVGPIFCSRGGDDAEDVVSIGEGARERLEEDNAGALSTADPLASASNALDAPSPPEEGGGREVLVEV